MTLGLHDLPLFALSVLALNATPGADLLFVVTRTLQRGARAGLAGAAGISAGCVVHALAAAFGLAALLAVSAGRLHGDQVGRRGLPGLAGRSACCVPR